MNILQSYTQTRFDNKAERADATVRDLKARFDAAVAAGDDELERQIDAELEKAEREAAYQTRRAEAHQRLMDADHARKKAREDQKRDKALQQKLGALERSVTPIEVTMSTLLRQVGDMVAISNSTVGLLPPHLRTIATPFHKTLGADNLREFILLHAFNIGLPWGNHARPGLLGQYKRLSDGFIPPLTENVAELCNIVRRHLGGPVTESPPPQPEAPPAAPTTPEPIEAAPAAPQPSRRIDDSLGLVNLQGADLGIPKRPDGEGGFVADVPAEEPAENFPLPPPPPKPLPMAAFRKRGSQ